MARVDDVAAAVLDRTGTVTSMKLQKLLYYCQAWHLARCGRALFADRIEAWPQGPVVRSVFSRHRRQFSVTTWPGSAGRLSGTEKSTVDWVVDRYGDHSAEWLVHLTHLELPWREARGDADAEERSSAEIPVAAMRDYYARQIASPGDAVGHAVANAALEGVDFDPAWQAELAAAAESDAAAEAAVARELARHL